MDILLVDDDAVDRQSIKQVLEQNPSITRLSEAETVEQGLCLLNEHNYDVILLDYRMPEVNGIEMVTRLRDRPNLGQTAIVMMSKSDDEQVALDCLHAGAQDFLQKKEITTVRLKQALLHARKRFELERELYESYRKVKDMAQTDALTGLYNRYHYEDALNNAIKNNKPQTHSVALMVLDLDRFKYVNDRYGHDAGDALLLEVVERIRRCLRGNEIFARLGGDEFAIVLTNIERVYNVNKLARRILRELDEPFAINGDNVRCSCSIGITLHPYNGETAAELTKYADIAMYRAKKLGRGQLCFFEETMQEEFSQRYQIELAIRDVIKGEHFRLHYQPIVDAGSKALTGFEALIRWPDTQVQYRPDQFIPVAEESHSIHEIGRWVIKEAVRQLSRWQQTYDRELTMAINLSPIQLGDRELVLFIQQTLERFDVDPESVTFELTETALLGNDKIKHDCIAAIHRLGCRIALDDFGTGFSSLSHLLSFPIDIVKIDRSILPVSDEPSKHLAVMIGLSSMLRSLGLSIVAEGVETPDQSVLCQALTIDKLQGYFFAKPQSQEEIELRLLSSASEKAELGSDALEFA